MSSGFPRLTQHWVQRRAMLEVIKKQNEKLAYKQQSFLQKFKDFWWLKKRRFFYVFCLYQAYQRDFLNRTIKNMQQRKEKNWKKYTKRWVK